LTASGGIRAPDSFDGARFADWVRVEIELDPAYADEAPFPDLGRELTQADFPAIAKAIQGQNRSEFGADADRPD
jgi:hypothetical protein